MNRIFSVSIVVSALLVGCTDTQQPQDKGQAAVIADDKKSQTFSVADAKNNLRFSKDQYLKLIENINNNNNLMFAERCKQEPVLCFPRSEEHGQLFMEKPEKWTNGFYPGLLWKLLSVSDRIDGFSNEQQQVIAETASHYQQALKSESKRGTTHDLGFILYDSYGEALDYSGLNLKQRQQYQQILNDGRDTLSTRFSTEYGVIKSWDFLPTLPTKYLQNGEVKSAAFDLANPWSYPVIVDNMMNLDFLFASDNQQYQTLAFTHAETTRKNHYFYTPEDVNKERPLSYHLIDYGTMKPGNWQGLGSISAWARGQAWSLYGFVTVVEAANRLGISEQERNTFEKHLDSLYESMNYRLSESPVPYWDFLADQDDAYLLAENMEKSTNYYSRILDLCDHEIPKETLPYVGYRPISIDSALLTESALASLSQLTSVTGESFIVNGKIAPCGTQAYDLNGRTIPRDTSAAAIMASALYRYAQTSSDQTKADKYVVLADKIMLELTQHYLSDKEKGSSYELGFVLTQATGNLPNTSEINTAIMYADFYFVEANIRKMQLATQ
ncbi:hypothetical protein [Thalassotalea sp. PLHSN55]|uniref:hypothetical protein n=1 Tax=Thalassotalea sp. PLHSN55 TaxID=3435888 RepID=UPI003F87B232